MNLLQVQRDASRKTLKSKKKFIQKNISTQNSTPQSLIQKLSKKSGKKKIPINLKMLKFGFTLVWDNQ